ncbi:sialin [Diaphorina citri]|uniref:Sialin n=1 Tax=Diaphorina citri TaxID=121845 RepID=A0A3Q0ILC3_DIACI|nr:sialin [Diaphorina citri]
MYSDLGRFTDAVPARVVLYMMSFTGFLVSFMMRTDINIAMVAMVKFQSNANNSNSNSSQPYCYVATEPGTSARGNVSELLFNDTMLLEKPNVNEEGEFDWDTTTQGAILSSFYWCYILSQVVGGVLTQRFGTKTVFGFSQLVTAICSLLIPQAAVLHYGALIALRSIQGIASGLTWPAMYALVGHWIPSNERSRFMSSFQGFSFGIGLTYPLCGFLIAHYGWRSVFYTTGSLGAIWCVAWWFLAFDAPLKHPRITRKELDYIQENIEPTIVGSKGLKVPWVSILTSPPAWAIGITTFGRIWVHYIFIIPGPRYMKTILGFSIQTNGLLTGAPFLCSYLSSVLFCYLADQLFVRNIMSLTNIRKVFTAISQVIPALLVMLIGYLGCNVALVLITWFVAVTLITASYAGAMANVVDIGPNFAGPILAFAQTIHMTASFLSPMVAGYFLQDDETSLESWRQVFLIAGAVGSCTYFFYQVLGTSEVQPWNQLKPATGSPRNNKSPEQKPFICEDGRRASIVKSNGTTSHDVDGINCNT